MGNGTSPQLAPDNNRMLENTAAAAAAALNAANDKVRKSNRSESLCCFYANFDTHSSVFFFFFIFGTYLQCEVLSVHGHPPPLWLRSVLIPSIGTLTRSGTSVLLLSLRVSKCFKPLLTSHHNNNTQRTHHLFITSSTITS